MKEIGKNKKQMKIEKSKKLMSFNEFTKINSMRTEYEAGFKAYINGINYLSESDWNKKFNEYKTRYIKN